MPTMSALGQKQTCAVHQPMSALPPIADICGATWDVRYGPKADISHRACHVCFTPEGGHQKAFHWSPYRIYSPFPSRIV
jgi:hypothetical protein